jgi:acyl-CoA thioesterase-2
MPKVVGPDGLTSVNELRRQNIDKWPAHMRAVLHAETAIEIRQCVPHDPFNPQTRAPRDDAWLRAADRLPYDPVQHQAMLAYASDFGLLHAALLPHGLSFMNGSVQAVSLDHAMWFHDEFRMDEWLLYATDSPAAHGARGFCRGSIYTQDGRLIASVPVNVTARPSYDQRSASSSSKQVEPVDSFSSGSYNGWKRHVGQSHLLLVPEPWTKDRHTRWVPVGQGHE